MGILEDVTGANARASRSNAAPAEERKKSEFWLNVGINLPGAGEDGADLFVSLPVGIPLDDLKPQEARGQNQNYIQLVQTKNALLAALQKAGGKMAPGERQPIEALSVELYRTAKPESTGTVEGNPLIAQLMGALTK